MRRFWFPGLVGLLLLVLAACGSSATVVPAAPAAKQAPAATEAPAAPAAVAAPAAAAKPAALAAYAAKFAGGPGAIYVGDLKQLVGPAPTKDQGDFDGNVPLEPLQRHRYIYESDYYKSLLAEAKLTNPTPLVSTGKNITIQYVCLNRALLFCKMAESYFAPNLLARTKGELKFTFSSQPELGIAGPDLVRLVSDGTLGMVEIFSGYVAGDLPPFEVLDLFGMFPDRETQFKVTTAVNPDMEKLVEETTGGGRIINLSWSSGNDFGYFTKKPMRTVADFKGQKFRGPGPAANDWIEGMGASAVFLAFSEVYTGLERGILDGAGAGINGGFGQRWYEVTKYLNGPLVNFNTTKNVINKDVWNKLPPDLQQILLEEGAKTELEALRVASIQNEMGLLVNIKAGMVHLEFSPEVRARSDAVVAERVVPNWVKRVGGGDKPFIKVFNEKIGPLVGLRVEPDGSVVKVPIVQGK